MHPHIKTLWLEALRSKRYTAGCGQLRIDTIRGPRWCAWGVLCELAVQHGVIRGYVGEDEMPPETVWEWAGINTEFPDVITVSTKNEISYNAPISKMSDDKMPFDHIADMISYFM